MLHALLTGTAVALALAPSAIGDEIYTPVQPVEPSLNATAYAECVRDAPWIDVDVTLVDPDGLSTSREVSLVFTEGARRHEVPLGALGEDDRLARRVLWPAATVDETGAGVDWPGWVRAGDEWRDVGDDDLGWTREGATVTLEVNPELVVAVSYPPAAPACVAGPRSTGAPARGPLAATGAEVAMPLLLGGGLVAAGLAFARARRRPRP